jgi:uncharacterized protein (DUF1778 family)
MLKREDFTAERARRIAEEVLNRGATPLMSEEARRASLAAFARPFRPKRTCGCSVTDR